MGTLGPGNYTLVIDNSNMGAARPPFHFFGHDDALIEYRLSVQQLPPSASSQAEAYNRAKMEVSNLAAGLDLFKYDMGRYPTTDEGLEALVRAPEGANNWHGPYVRQTMSFTDPWGNPYHYQYPGQHREFDLFSYGPGTDNSGQPPVANW